MSSLSSLAGEFLAQQTVAVVGISSAKETVANGVYKKLKSGRRNVYAVGKHTSAFDGDPCYADLASLPAPVDGVFIAARPENILRTVDECIEQRIPRLWIHHFSGKLHEGKPGIADPIASVAQKCREHGITLIPGACPMMFAENADVGHRCIKWVLSLTGRLQ